MRPFATLLTLSLLAFTGARASNSMILPDGYEVMYDSIKRIPNKFQYKHAKKNPNIPRFNATLSCDIETLPLYKVYRLSGRGWPGLTEKMIKAVAKGTAGRMSKWKYRSWEKSVCTDWEDGAQMCTPEGPGWGVQFRLTRDAGDMLMDERLVTEFNRLTGMYGHDHRTVSWFMTNGTNTKEGNL